MFRHHSQLVLTFDAFGTLFAPREPIGRSYAVIARRHGMSGFTDDQIASTFRDAFKREQNKAPNYGRKVGMGASQWWSNVIHTTFSSFTSSSALPPKLVPDLLHRFASSDGYRMFEDVGPMFEDLRQIKRQSNEDPTFPKLSVGIITNSDDRVPSVLSSLGLKVSPRRIGLIAEEPDPLPDKEQDIDFTIMSYDVGYEKPSREIFDAAKRLMQQGFGELDQGVRFIHVGDDLEKDFGGAERAGWESILLDRDRAFSEQCTQKLGAIRVIRDLRELIPHLNIDQ